MVPTQKSEKRKPAGKSLVRKVRFEFSAPEAREVHLVGDFNHWDTQANLMVKDRKGIWKATLPLQPGRFEYRFFVDGNWRNDPSSSGFVPNQFGSENCVRIVE